MTTRSKPARFLAAATLAATMAVTTTVTTTLTTTLTTTAAHGSAAVPAQAAGTSAAGAVAAPAIPDTPAGKQLGWVLEAVSRAPLPEAELRAHFTAGFLASIPPAQLNQALATFKGMKLERLTSTQDRQLVARVLVGRTPIDLALTVDGGGLIDGLRFGAPEVRSWSEADRRLRAIAPRTGFLAAELTAGGGCRPVHAIAAGKRLPLGSMIKLYVLGTVAQQIKSGRFGWDTELTITRELKSLPGGELQERPDGSKVTVLEAAKLMISISDNTATDLLIHKVGRKAVERTLRSWGVRDRRNEPLLTTRDLFVLKGVKYPRHARKYLAMSDAKQRSYLEKVVAGQDLSAFELYTAPRELDTVEWFASPKDICRAYAELVKLGDERVGQVMSINDAGLGLDKKAWPTVWFKGGSEPGLSDLSFLARTAGGKTYVVVAMGADGKAPISEAATLDQVAVARGAFTLANGS
ncbi:serine hydrolase [Nonomuraea salmonea]|uniref:Serine hydrolase n=1 Tax=Nonomuraea salmonea TaxID=46181 RepID=A0ABV5NTK3_9ACTN